MVFNLFLVHLFCASIAGIYAFSEFKAIIPNGNNVPNPCVPNTKWKAAGHINILGGGKRNPFGIDFFNNELKWDRTLCIADSDGDGRSNGLELGDEECKWTQESGLPPDVTLLNNLTHPGICEPMDSPNCKSLNPEGLCAQKAEYECDFNVTGVDNDVSSISVQIDETEVPAQETTYICQSFDLDELLPDPTKPYHLVGSEPILVNQNVMHHIIVRACANDSESVERYRTPTQCGMLARGECSSRISGWTVGLPGRCTQGDYGYRIGAGSGHRYIIIEMHWNNPLKHSGTTDASGMKFYVTPNVRKYDLGSMLVGQMNLRLEPGKDRIEQTGMCSAACTKQALQDREIFIVDSTNHMHYLGVEGHLEVLRDGEVIHQLAIDREYEYDSPVRHGYPEPIPLRGGDEIRMRCVFNTMSRTNTVFYGDSTQAEMCFGFMSYYPNNLLNQGLRGCIAFGEADICEIRKKTVQNGCNVNGFRTRNSTVAGFVKVMRQCREDECTQACRDTLNEWYESEPCLKDQHLRSLVIFNTGTAQSESFPYGEKVANMMRMCEENGDNTSGGSTSLHNLYPLVMTYLVSRFL